MPLSFFRQIFKQFLTNRVLKDPRQRRFFKSNDLYELFSLADSDMSKRQGTETEAIFADSGSTVTVKPKKQKNRFDEMRKKKAEYEDLDSDDDLSSLVRTTKEDRMRLLAKQLARSLVDKSYKPNLSLGRGFPSSKAKKKKPSAKFEGVKIPGLTSTALSSNKQSDSEARESQQQQDDYVLRKLLKRTNVQSAIKHDVIVSKTQPDYDLVEGEAERIARLAAAALRNSRMQCNNIRQNDNSLPTWTGRHGFVGAPPGIKPRFGPKRKLADTLVKPFAKKPKNQTVDETDEHENSNENAETLVEESVPASSSDLLKTMKRRNYRFLESYANEVEDFNYFTQPTSSEDDKSELISDLRTFIAFGGSVDGQASTQEILDVFKHRLPPSDTPLFRAFLRQLCTFHRMSGLGVWRLKPDFR